MTVPFGRLPVYSVDTEEEAKLLVVLVSSMGTDGKYYSPELAYAREHLDALEAYEVLEQFSAKIEWAHRVLKERGKCQCKGD